MAEEQIQTIDGVFGVYRVIAPYASSHHAPDEAIALEASPRAALCFRTALFLHGLTPAHPTVIQCIHFPKSTERLPLGTTPEDWLDNPTPPSRNPKTIGERQVSWTMAKPAYDFGIRIGFLDGTALYVTDLERTLADTLRFPEPCGGLKDVFQSWRNAAEQLDVSRLTSYVDRLGQNLLRQRVGWMLDELQIDFPNRGEWLAHVQRGGSAKLHAAAPFSDVYSEPWAISLNVPPHIIAELKD